MREDFLVRSFPLTVLNWTPQDLLKVAHTVLGLSRKTRRDCFYFKYTRCRRTGQICKLSFVQAVLPEGEEGVSGYSLIGHIVHLNLRVSDTNSHIVHLKPVVYSITTPQEPLLPYKEVIGQALLLTKGVRSVVNKSSTIANTYRNFAMELLAGEEDYQVLG